MEGVTHCHSHRRFAKFHGLMYGGKYSAVIGRKARFWYVPIMNFQAMGYFKLTTAPCLPLYIKPRNFAKRQCERQWVTPPRGTLSARRRRGDAGGRIESRSGRHGNERALQPQPLHRSGLRRGNFGEFSAPHPKP